MKHSKQLFIHYTAVWARLLQQSASTKDPATYLLAHDARTPVFYLEGMSRVLMHVHNPKKMRRLNEWFKVLEDALGQMDHYAGLLKTFKSNRKIPASIKQEWRTQLSNASEHLNTLLLELGWLGEHADRLRTVHKTLQDMDWLGDKDMNRALKARYRSDIESIITQLKRPVREIEKDIHELRRDVRWLSIYPQAFKGFIGLSAQTSTANDAPSTALKTLDKYATPAITQSPYNQLPSVEGIERVLQLNTPAYYAMSWLIAQLGVLKDSGLGLLAVAEILRSQRGLNKAEALTQAKTMLGVDQASVADLLNTARGIVKQIQEDRVFEQLLPVKAHTV